MPVACKKEQAQRTLTIAFPSTIKSFDPYSEATQISGSIFNRVFGALTFHSSQLEVQPSVATRWSNPNENTWIFELRRDVRFHDGTPLTAEDVKFSFETLKNTTTAPQSTALSALKQVDVLDPYTVRVVTHQPTSNFVRRLFAISLVSRKSYVAGAQEIIPGSGPYRIKSWESGAYVHLEAADTYWGPRPPVREIRFEAISNSDESVRKLLDGSVDVIPLLEPDSVERYGLRERDDIVVRNYPGMLVIYLAFNTMHDRLPGSTLDSNPFRDHRVRQAVYQAINTDRLIQTIQKGYADQATQVVAPLVYGFNPEIRRLPYEPETARNLLAEAGYASGFSVRLDIPNNRYRSDAQVGNAVVEDLGAVGIKVELNSLPIDQWMRIRTQNQTPFFMAGWMVTSGDAAGAVDYIVHTPETTFGYGRTNSGGYSNPEIDTVIERAAGTMDPNERLLLLKTAMDLAMKDVAVVPLYIEQNLSAYRKDVDWIPRVDGLLDVTTFRFTR